MGNLAWGIDIGSTSIKAVLMRASKGQCTIEEFDEIPVKQSDDPIAQKRAIGQALVELTTNHRFGRTPVYAIIENKYILIRQFDLPPGSETRLSELVQYEAKQQIPFPLDQVEWDYVSDVDSDRVSVTIFAVRKFDVVDIVSKLCDVRLNIQGIVPSGLALRNFIRYEFAEDVPTLVLNAGHLNTDFVTWSTQGVYIRNINLAGEAVTKALANKFKVPAEKAEDLKKNIAKSPNADSILEAMMPTIGQVGEEIKRTMGFYTSKRLPEIQRYYLMGHLFRIPRVAETVQQRMFGGVAGKPMLSLIEGLQRIRLDHNINAEVWKDCFPAMAPAIGVALQGCSQADMSVVFSKPAKMALAESLKPIAVGVIFVCLLIMGLVFIMSDKSQAPAPIRAPQPRAGDVPKKVVSEVAKMPVEGDFVREPSGLADTARSETFVLRDKASGRRFLVLRSLVTGDACVALIPEKENK